MTRGFVRETDWVAECFFANSSAFSKDVFYLEAFALPLFVPTEHLYVNYGFRVGRYENVNAEVVKAVQKARGRLAKMSTLEGLEKAASSNLDIRSRELKMYAAILRDSVDRAEEDFETISLWKVERDWESEVIDRAARIAALLRASGRSGAMEALKEHREAVRGLLT